MNRNDRKIALAALAVATAAVIGIYVVGHDGQQPATDDQRLPARYDRARQQRAPIRYATDEVRKVERFPFDPNTADSSQLLRLGLQPWQVRNIYKYRSRGGIYRRKEDFARLYGLTVKEYRELEPYIRISADYLPAATLVGDRERPATERDTLRYPVKIKADEHVVLNTADTTQLKRVPGIGSYYARRIANYGQRLGGYVSVDQLDEIEGFPQEAKKYFVVQAPEVRKLNVNRLTLQQLRQHPYINYFQAKAITDYRRLHGKLNSLQDLRLSPDFPPAAIERLQHYVEY